MVEESMNQLKGTFAFALYDHRERIGEKPLYYGIFKINLFLHLI